MGGGRRFGVGIEHDSGKYEVTVSNMCSLIYNSLFIVIQSLFPILGVKLKTV